MDAELKAKWIAALRSGEFKQTDCQLHDGMGAHCCLGVLCVVADIDPDEPIAYDELGKMLSKERILQCEMMNDWSHATFPEIADWLESQP